MVVRPTLLASIWSTMPRMTALLIPLVKRSRMPVDKAHTLLAHDACWQWLCLTTSAACVRA